MLATSTHDTKRTEDVRARLHVLTEMPGAWRTAVNRFARTNKRFVHEVDGEPAPCRNDQYLFYQSLLGIWPLFPPDAAERKSLVERLTQYMEKATREAKQRTSWINPNHDYDATVREFVAQTLRDSPRNRFLKDLLALHAQIVQAGQYNALAQLTLKLLAPGVPDIYQGQELWNFSLVDPDNRRPVDYDLRRWLLAEIHAWDRLPEDQRQQQVIALGRSWADPRLKLLVTHRLLALRRQRHDLLHRGQYVPLDTTGPLAQHLVALGWRREEQSPLELIAVVPRHLQGLLAARSADDRSGPLWVEGAWSETGVSLPADSQESYRCLFSERTIAANQNYLPVVELLADFPLSVLCRV
jgi:(1->4)-alpha-D-glucan 1-alpha-D-glucosylmutase